MGKEHFYKIPADISPALLCHERAHGTSGIIMRGSRPRAVQFRPFRLANDENSTVAVDGLQERLHKARTSFSAKGQAPLVSPTCL